MQKTGDEYILFLYDENGTAYGMVIKNGTTEEYYYYLFNAQGDVIGIVDSTGEQVAAYEYGAWGDVTSITGSLAQTIGEKNPIRYRGYYYDTETGFYYLQSRYYDPEVSRFINADGLISAGQDILGCNVFAYCVNNPINRSDPNGNLSFISFLSKAITIVRIVKTVLRISNKKHNSKVDSNPKTSTKGKIINDQNGATGKNFRYGRKNVSWNGCETIAVHNAKLLKGKNSSLSETIDDFHAVNAIVGFGLCGSNPYSIGSVLEKEDISYTGVGLNDMTKQGVYIISFWNENPLSNGLHTVAVSYDGTYYTAYNLYCNGDEYHISLSDYSTSFICGYYLR